MTTKSTGSPGISRSIVLLAVLFLLTVSNAQELSVVISGLASNDNGCTRYAPTDLVAPESDDRIMAGTDYCVLPGENYTVSCTGLTMYSIEDDIGGTPSNNLPIMVTNAECGDPVAGSTVTYTCTDTSVGESPPSSSITVQVLPIRINTTDEMIELIDGDDPRVTVGQVACFLPVTSDPTFVCPIRPRNLNREITWTMDGRTPTAISSSPNMEELTLFRLSNRDSLRNFTTTFTCSVETGCNGGAINASLIINFLNVIQVTVDIGNIGDNGCNRFNVDVSQIINGVPIGACPIPGERVTIGCRNEFGTHTLVNVNTSAETKDVIEIQSFGLQHIGQYQCRSDMNLSPCDKPAITTLLFFETVVPSIAVSGRNVCIISDNDPTPIVFDCGNTRENDVRANPKPTATWTRPATVPSSVISEGNNPTDTTPDNGVASDNRDGFNTLLTITNDGTTHFTNLVGTYTCQLMNLAGSDTAEFNIFTVPSINPDDTTFELTDDTVIVGNNTCEYTRQNTRTRIVCEQSEGVTSLRWFVNGMLLENAPEVLTNQGPGMYTCERTNMCGGGNVTTNVIGRPSNFTRPGPTPPDGPDVVYTIGQDICLNIDISGNATIQCRLSMELDSANPPMWTKAGDPSFSFTGEFLSLPRSDPNTPGIYTCTISTGPDGACGFVSETSTVRVNSSLVQVPPNASVLNIGNDACEVDFNQLYCQTSPMASSVRWIVNGRESTTMSNIFSPLSPGIYICIAMDGCGGTLTAQTEIFSRPSISIRGSSASLSIPNDDGCSRSIFTQQEMQQYDLCLIRGEQLTIQCDSSNMRFEITKVNDPDVMAINQPYIVLFAQRSDTGTYICTTDGGVCGSVAASLNVIIRVSRPNINTNTTENATVVGNPVCLLPNQVITLTCEASGENLMYQWTDSSNTVIGTTANLFVDQVGDYTCTVSNSGGTDMATSRVFDGAPTNFRVTASTTPSRCNEFSNVPAGVDLCYTDGDQITLTCQGSLGMMNGVIRPDGEIGTKNIRVTQANNNQTFTCGLDNMCDTITSLRFFVQEVEERKEWSPGPWSKCNPNCHSGFRTRNIVCRGVDSRVVCPDADCTDPRPDTNETCSELGPCFSDPVWVPQDWSACTASCGGGYRVRNLICQIPQTQEIVPNARCDGLPRPSTFDVCNTQRCCTRDIYPMYCRLICGTALCDKPRNKEVCCVSCP